MNNKKLLNITIANPCQENWQSMTPQGNGRLCSTCKKVVVDFSLLSNDELHNYFSKTTEIPCGRFHNDQLNRKIIPDQNKKGLFRNIHKVAAILFTILTLKHPSFAANKKVNTVQTAPDLFNEFVSSDSDKVIISGIVKDQLGQPLENAEVKFGELTSAKTDAYGNFEFELPETKEIKPGLLIFSYPGLIKQIRSYYPAMFSTTYNIILYEKTEMSCSYTMGIPAVNKLKALPATIDCSRSEFWTNYEKALLATIASELRNNPQISINLIAYSNKKKEKTRSMWMQLRLKTYFIEMEGIGEERLKLVIRKDNPVKEKTVEIEQQENQ